MFTKIQISGHYSPVTTARERSARAHTRRFALAKSTIKRFMFLARPNIPALTAMFFCFSQGKDSLEHLNGVEYDEYIVYNEELLDKEGNRAASFFVEDFSLEKFVEEGLGDRDDVEEDSEPVMIMYKQEGGNTLLCWDDVWYAGTLHYGEDGYVYVKLPKDTERKEYTVPSVYHKGARVYYWCLGDSDTRELEFSEPEGKAPSNEVCIGFAKLLLKAHHGEDVSLTYNVPEMERRIELSEKLQEKARFSNQNWLNHEWQWHGYLGNPDETMKAMGVEPLVKPGRVPNVNYRDQGFKELRKQLETLIAKQSGAVVHMHKGIDNGEIVEWDFCLANKTRLHVSMANAYSSTQAMKMMYTYPERFFDDNFGGLSREIGLAHKYNCEQLPDMLEFAEGVAGEHTIRMRQPIGEDGLPVKGSEKRSIYFTRGNTAVGVFTDNPAFNVLPAARAIDKLLVEGMRKAGEPLTREQDYLKEDKGKKQK